MHECKVKARSLPADAESAELVQPCELRSPDPALGAESGAEGEMALLKAEEAELPVEEGSEFLCGSVGKLTAEYTVTEPQPLYVTES